MDFKDTLHTCQVIVNCISNISRRQCNMIMDRLTTHVRCWPKRHGNSITIYFRNVFEACGQAIFVDSDRYKFERCSMDFRWLVDRLLMSLRSLTNRCVVSGRRCVFTRYFVKSSFEFRTTSIPISAERLSNIRREICLVVAHIPNTPLVIPGTIVPQSPRYTSDTVCTHIYRFDRRHGLTLPSLNATSQSAFR